MKTGTRVLSTVWIVGLATLAVHGFENRASADTFDERSSAGGYEPDNQNHWGCWELGGGTTIPVALSDQFFWGLPSTTAVDAYWDDPCNNATDVWLRDDIVDNTAPILLGEYVCLALNGQGECERSRVRSNDTYYAANAPDFYCYTYHNWCHEMGHSLGLKHTETEANCLRSGMRDACVFPEGDYRAHHVLHINNDIN